MPNFIRSRLSLRSILVVPFVALLLGLATTIGALSYLAGQHAVLKVSEHLLLETVGRIGQAIDRHVVGSGAVLEAAFPNGMAAPEDVTPAVDSLRTRFWIATSLHIDPNNYVYYGNQAGQSIGLFRPSLAEGELRIKLKAQDNRSRFSFRGIGGPLHYESTETKLFDPRERPWYKAAAATSTDTWTSVYIDFSTGELVATRARRVPNADGQFAGVVATDMSLRALNDFVRDLKVSPQGMAFIIEPNGDLIASSSSPNVRLVKGGPSTRINAADSGNSLLTQIYKQVKAAELDDVGATVARTLAFTDVEGQDIHVGYDTITDASGLRWITIAAMPSSDFMGGVNENLWRTAVVSGLAAVAALSLGLWILQWVVGDLKHLTKAAKDVGDGLMSTPLDIDRRDEIGDLAQSFATMRHQLQIDRLTGIANRDAFERRVAREIDAQTTAGGDGFSVLFIDLNGFKAINDQFGHAAGDALLIEVGRRLEAVVRRDDLPARYAGDEFVIFLGGVQNTKATELVRQLIADELAKGLAIRAADGSTLTVELSAAIGHAHFPSDATDGPTLVKIADRDMYRRKQDERKPKV